MSGKGSRKKKKRLTTNTNGENPLSFDARNLIEKIAFRSRRRKNPHRKPNSPRNATATLFIRKISLCKTKKGKKSSTNNSIGQGKGGTKAVSRLDYSRRIGETGGKEKKKDLSWGSRRKERAGRALLTKRKLKDHYGFREKKKFPSQKGKTLASFFSQKKEPGQRPGRKEKDGSPVKGKKKPM